MIHTFKGWIEHYNKHSKGDKWAPPEGAIILFAPERGILAYHIDRDLDVLYVDNMAGDARYWYEQVGKKIIAKEGLSGIRMFTRRNPRTIARYHAKNYGLKITGIEIEIKRGE